MNVEAVPVPVEQGVPVRAKVTTLPDGRWSLAWGHDGGLRVEPFGDPFPNVRAACKAAQRINARIEAP